MRLEAQESSKGHDGSLDRLPSCSLAELKGLDFAITGTSTLEAAATVAESTESVSYLNLSRFVAFLEGILFHDRVVVLGEPNGETNSFCRRLEASTEEEIFLTLPLDPDSDLYEAQATLNRLLRHAFDGRLDQVTIERLCKKSRRGWQTDVLRTEFRELAEKEATEEIAGSGNLRAGLIDYLVSEFKRSALDPDHQYLTNHLLRHFLHGAIADECQGSLLGGGNRDWLAPLTIPLPRSDFHLQSQPLRLFRMAATTFHYAVRPRGRDYGGGPDPLAIELFRCYAETSGSALGALTAARNDLRPFRVRLRERELVLNSESSSLRERLKERAAIQQDLERMLRVAASGEPSNRGPSRADVKQLVKSFIDQFEAEFAPGEGGVSATFSMSILRWFVGPLIRFVRELGPRGEISPLVSIIDQVYRARPSSDRRLLECEKRGRGGWSVLQETLHACRRSQAEQRSAS